MRYIVSMLTACALAGAITAFAQQPPPQQEPAKPAAEAATITGCVQEAKTTDGGKAYLLNKAQGGSAPMYVLVGPSASEVASHVNHKIEVTGQVVQPPPPAEGAPPADPKVLRPPMVQVESLKVIAESCE